MCVNDFYKQEPSFRRISLLGDVIQILCVFLLSMQDISIVSLRTYFYVLDCLIISPLLMMQMQLSHLL